MSKVCQYLHPSCYTHKHHAQLCSHLFGYHYAQNYASIIHQGLFFMLHASDETLDGGLGIGLVFSITARSHADNCDFTHMSIITLSENVIV